MRTTIGRTCEWMLSAPQSGSVPWGKALPSGRLSPRKSVVCKGSEHQPLAHTQGLLEEVTFVKIWNSYW